MFLELIKKASTQGLSLTFDYKEGILSCDCIDEADYSWYSYSSTNPFELMVTVNDYLTNPVEFTSRFNESTCGVIEISKEEAMATLGE